MKDLELLVQYHDGELNDTQKQELAERLKTDPGLSQKLDLIKDVDHLLGNKQLATFEKSLHEAESAYLQKAGKNSTATFTRLAWLKAAAAAIIILTGISLFFVVKSKASLNNDELFAAYYQKLPAEFATRSEEKSKDDFIHAIKLYNENRYKEAITHFSRILEKDPTNNAARLFLGISLTETLDYKNAASQFKIILNQNDPIFEEHAAWYLSLCYIKTNHPDEARPLLSSLVNSRSFYMGKATELLKKIK